MTRIGDIARVIRADCPLTARSNIYAFGSYLRNGFGVDIDLLLVSDDRFESGEVRREIMERFPELPIEITILTPAEELETDFIAEQQCVALEMLG
ncbi:MAG: nucleotidyltransferase domain-containing protein [Pseudomonadota bacterium]